MEWLNSAPYGQRLGLLLMADLVTSQYVWRVVAAIPAGRQRMAAAAPVVAVNMLTPLLFRTDGEIVTRVAIAFTHVWCDNEIGALKVHEVCRERSRRLERPRQLRQLACIAPTEAARDVDTWSFN